MFIESRRMVCFNGEEKQAIINKARLKTHFIDIRPFWGENFEQGVKGIAKWKRLLDTISSKNFLNMEDVNPFPLIDI
jgi:hypothetical protein